MLHSSFGCFFSSHLCSKRSALTAATETEAACGGPAQNITFGISDGNDSIIEGGADMCYTVDYVFANFFLVPNNLLASHWFIPPSLIISSCLQ